MEKLGWNFAWWRRWSHSNSSQGKEGYGILYKPAVGFRPSRVGIREYVFLLQVCTVAVRKVVFFRRRYSLIPWDSSSFHLIFFFFQICVTVSSLITLAYIRVSFSFSSVCFPRKFRKIDSARFCASALASQWVGFSVLLRCWFPVFVFIC